MKAIHKDLRFRMHTVDPAGARRAEFTTAHGTVETPAFMPVGTAGFVRSTTPKDVMQTGAQVLLANTYHLMMSERLATVQRAGGLHQFMGWKRTILTDSGGFQVFSLPQKEISEDGVSFSFQEDGQRLFLSPERSMELQMQLGADIVMAFDECVEYPATESYVAKSLARTTRWAQRCRKSMLQEHQFLFGIVQGGVYPELRSESARQITDIDFDGYAIGGVSVGEGFELMGAIVRHTAPLLPENKPRYLMGVGLPEDILEAVSCGMDMFDCVIPTRYARNGTLFTRTGKIRIMDKNFRKDRFPIDTGCRCYTCQTYSRMVLRYLFFSHDPLAETLATIHNLTFYQDLMRDIRIAIEKHQFDSFRNRWMETYGRKSAPEPRRGDGSAAQPAPERASKSSRQAASTKHSDAVQRVLQRFGRR
ncbi:tRNA guanosine(34) transglycosylase Tgt [Desulfatirhabdium butyrativorans]|uniref:tRNA guanosine(34) transglycosylase Tgt n=1 Tax=Desulfatirhabdium butyrativorans TaxID=340467 RepID=UPI001FDF8000|nr:tRNA guanosine(34) transglycosylase Tgt [Desulfatirhabdium butyrativorans]